MKTKLIALGAAIAAIAAPTVASAQAGWQPINARQANLYNRIDQGVRSGALTRPEANRLRAEFQQINRLEYRYRSNGLSLRERQDLQRRFDVLSAKVRFQKNDRQDRRYR